MKLLIGIPTLDFMYVEFVKCLFALLDKLRADGIDYTLDIQSGTLVYLARERIAHRAINDGYDYVLWLDSDMIFSPSLFDDLMDNGKEVITGVYHARRKGFASCIFKCIDTTRGVERFETYPSETFQIDACGFGCIVTKSSVLRDVCVTYGECFTPMQSLGEDIAFCKRAKQLGHEIWCDPCVVCGHVGHIAIYPEDYERWKDTISNYDEVRPR